MSPHLFFAACLGCLLLGTPGSSEGQPNKPAQPPGLKMVISERLQLPSQMPWAYAELLDPESPRFILKKEDILPAGFMTWSFFVGALDPDKISADNLAYFFAMNPKHIRPMMEDLKDLDPELVEKLAKNPKGALLGRERLARIKKRVGDTLQLKGINHFKEIDLELEIVGALPEGRYDLGAIMNQTYLRQALDRYQKENGKAHPLADKSLSLIWLLVRDQAAFDRIAAQIEKAPQFADPPVRCESLKDAAKLLEKK
jgi:hypothetical protein